MIRLEEQINDLTELHQNEMENIRLNLYYIYFVTTRSILLIFFLVSDPLVMQGGRALPPLPLFPFYLPLFSSLLSFSFFLHSISPNPMKAQIFAPHPRRGANRKIYAPEINQYNEDDFLLILP